MAIEIERKFLVQGDSWRAAPRVFYAQGYLCHDKARTVRVRNAGERAFLTIKGLTHQASRAEFEYEIPLEDAKALLLMCPQPLIEKYRYQLMHAGFLWEVDEFLGDNAGLVVAEIELPSEDTAFERPAWVGEEVTADSRYYNASLSLTPFCRW